MSRVLLRPRWVVLHVIMLVAMPLFAVAGFWQLRRLDERRATNALVESRRELSPVTALDGDVTFRRAQLRGRYLPDDSVELTGRPSRGRPGHHVLTPLALDGGTVIVDRGWVPSETSLDDVRTPSEDVVVEGILFPSEERAPFTSGEGATTSMTRIDIERLDRQIDPDLAGVYVLLRRQRPQQPGGLPFPVDPAPSSEGSHRAYAVQWFLFIPTAIAVYVLVLRREVKHERARTAEPR